MNAIALDGPDRPARPSAGGATFAYSSENLLTSASGGITLAYDPMLRLYQTAGGSGGTRRYAYDGMDLIAEYNSSNAMLRRYVHGPGSDEPLVWYEGSGTSDRRFLHSDERGSVIATSNSSGSTLSTNAFDEYGIPKSTNTGRFQYTGQTWLPELGMYYYKARIYSPTMGRFLQTDPIGYGDGMNLYAYVGGDPVSMRDPSGLLGEDCPGTLIASLCAEENGARLRLVKALETLGLPTDGLDDESLLALADSVLDRLKEFEKRMLSRVGPCVGGVCGTDQYNSNREAIILKLWADPQVRSAMKEAWWRSNAGGQGEETEHGFWLKARGSDFDIGPMHLALVVPLRR